nr:glycoside hydrolase family 3 C-terminal domain-containing protein [Gemmatimonadota bacterium]
FTNALAGEGRRVDAVRLDERTSPAEYAALLARADSADVVIATAYVVPREYRGTVAAAAGFPEFVQALATARKPVVAVSFGSPYLLGSFAAVPAYLLAWGGADVSQRAAARALLGQSPITGRLPVSIPPFHRFGEGLDRPTRAITVSQ